jgi:hypothetical protein
VLAVLKLKKSCNFVGVIELDTDFRRLELQKLEGLGFLQVKIVKELARKLHVLSVGCTMILRREAVGSRFCRA